MKIDKNYGEILLISSTISPFPIVPCQRSSISPANYSKLRSPRTAGGSGFVSEIASSGGAIKYQGGRDDAFCAGAPEKVTPGKVLLHTSRHEPAMDCEQQCQRSKGDEENKKAAEKRSLGGLAPFPLWSRLYGS